MIIPFRKILNIFLGILLLFMLTLPLIFSYQNNNKRKLDYLKVLDNYANAIKLNYFQNQNIEDWIEDIDSIFTCQEIYFEKEELILKKCTVPGDETEYCYNKKAKMNCNS